MGLLVLDSIDLSAAPYRIFGELNLAPAPREHAFIQSEYGESLTNVSLRNISRTVPIRVYSDHATLTGRNAVNANIGMLARTLDKAAALADRGGVTLTIQPAGAGYSMTADCIGGTVDDVNYTSKEERTVTAEVKLTLFLKPICYGPEYTAGTASKAAGAPALSATITGVKGDVPSPARIVIDNTSAQDQSFAAFGCQFRDYDAAQSLILRAPSMVVTDYSGTLTAATNETQTLGRTGTPTAGTWTYSLDGKTTGAIAWNATAATIQTAIEALANVGTGNVACTGGPINTTNVTITFQGALAGCDISLGVIVNSVTGGSYSLSTLQTGGGGWVAAYPYNEWTTLCSTGNLGHVGSYRVIARVYDEASLSDVRNVAIQLAWGLGDLSAITINPAASPVAAGGFCLIDLGQVHIPTVATGTQRWTGTIEIKTTTTIVARLRVYDLMFLPLEIGSGDIRAVVRGGEKRLVASDPTFAAAAGALNGDLATLGGAWTTSGDVTDFQDGTDVVTRTEVSDVTNAGRMALSAAAALGACEVHIRAQSSTYVGVLQGVIARYVDSNNYLIAYKKITGFPSDSQFVVSKRIAGSFTVLGTTSAPVASTASHGLRIRIDDTGAWQFEVDGTVILSGLDSALASAGALATGLMGFYDESPTASAATRSYSAFIAHASPSASPAIYNGQSLDFRSDGQVLREIATGNVWGTPSRATVPAPPALGPGTNRLLLLTSRNNPDRAYHTFPDQFDATIYHKPAYVVGRWEA